MEAGLPGSAHLSIIGAPDGGRSLAAFRQDGFVNDRLRVGSVSIGGPVAAQLLWLRAPVGNAAPASRVCRAAGPADLDEFSVRRGIRQFHLGGKRAVSAMRRDALFFCCHSALDSGPFAAEST